MQSINGNLSFQMPCHRALIGCLHVRRMKYMPMTLLRFDRDSKIQPCFHSTPGLACSSSTHAHLICKFDLSLSLHTASHKAVDVADHSSCTASVSLVIACLKACRHFTCRWHQTSVTWHVDSSIVNGIKQKSQYKHHSISVTALCRIASRLTVW